MCGFEEAELEIYPGAHFQAGRFGTLTGIG
jgi:hypothetical protein